MSNTDNFRVQNEQAKKIDDNTQKLLSFYVNDRLYAVPIEIVSEIIGIQDISFVPRLPHFIKGVTNIRGKVVPIIELRARFENPSAEYNDRTCIVIVEHEDINVGFIIDEISDVLTTSKNEMINSEPSVDEENEFISGIVRTENGIALLLDVEKTISVEELVDVV